MALRGGQEGPLGPAAVGWRRSALVERLIEELSSRPSASEEDDTAFVRGLIELLDDVDREIVRLVYWDGFSLNETAQILSMRPATVRSRHSRARAKLRDELTARCGKAGRADTHCRGR